MNIPRFFRSKSPNDTLLLTPEHCTPEQQQTNEALAISLLLTQEVWYSANLQSTLLQTSAEELAVLRKFVDRAKKMRSK